MPHLTTAAYLAFQLAAFEAATLNHPLLEPEHLLIGVCKACDYADQANPDPANVTDSEWSLAMRELSACTVLFNRLAASDLPPAPSGASGAVTLVQFRRRLRGLVKQQLPSESFSGHRSDRCRKIFSLADQAQAARQIQRVTIVMLLREVLACQDSVPLDQLFQSLQQSRKQWLGQIRNDDLRAGWPVSGSPAPEQADRQPDAHREPEASTPDQRPGAAGTPDSEAAQPAPVDRTAAKGAPATPLLDKFGRDLTTMARAGKLDPVIGRRDEIRTVARILLRHTKGNPLLVGEAGVGKTCIVEGLAQRIMTPGVAPQIQMLRIVELNLNAIVAGTKYRGDFEERLEKIIREAASDPNIVLFIDEIHTILAAGASEESTGAANILKPALARGEIRCIGATTTSEYRKYIEKDAALTRRFQVVWVEEPTRSEAVAILKGLAGRLEEHHHIQIPDPVIERAVDLSIRYLRDFRLPDKAVDLIDQACATRQLLTIAPGVAASQPAPGSPVEPAAIPGQAERAGWPLLTVDDIHEVVAAKTRIPVEQIALGDQRKITGLLPFLRSRIAGQDEALNTICETLTAAKVGLRDPGKPLAVFLFLGPTGTGKTETAKCLAEYLFDDPQSLITIDMSEYQEKHALSRLIGAPPGYIGYDEEGQLVSRIRTRPYSVVVFDEIEKAAPEIFDIFLQIFDEGRLTDAHGRTVYFTEAIIVMTSNLGNQSDAARQLRQRIGFPLAQEAAAAARPVAAPPAGADARPVATPAAGAIGPTAGPAAYPGASPVISADEKLHAAWRQTVIQAVTATLRPEIINRIQKMIFFYPLSRAAMDLIVNRLVCKLNIQLAARSLSLQLDTTALNLIMEQGFNQVYGARETQRTFERLITEPLARLIADGQFSPGQAILASAGPQGLHFTVCPGP